MPSLFSILGLIEAYLDVLQISVGELPEVVAYATCEATYLLDIDSF
jgi:hypothetical protein